MTHIEQRIDTAAALASINPDDIYEGEAVHESDTGRWKIGDGVSAYNDLPYKAGVDSVAGKTGGVELVVADVAGAAPLASPTFTGNPKAPTRSTSDNTTSIATTAFVKAALALLVDSSPAALDTLNELAAALGDDPAFAASMATAMGLKAPLASPVFTGNPTAPTPAVADRDTSLATTDFVHNVVEASGSWVDYAPSVSPWTLHATEKWFRYRLVGTTLSLAGAFRVNSFPVGYFEIGLPGGLVGYLGSQAQYRAVGTWAALRQDVSRHSDVAALTPTGLALVFMVNNDAPFFVQSDNPVTWLPGDSFSFEAEFEVQPY